METALRHAGGAPDAPPSLAVRGDAHLANNLCSRWGGGGQGKPLPKAKGLGKENTTWLSKFGTLQDHCELGAAVPPDTGNWPLAWF